MTKQILNVYYGNSVDMEHEAATGTNGVLIKLGQGEYPEYIARKCDLIKRCEDAGLPWGGFWQNDARYSPEGHKRAIKQTYDVLGFGKLGFFLAVEFPFYPMFDRMYWLFPYCNYKNVESVWRGIGTYTGKNPDWYSSVSKWNLIMGSYTTPDPRKASRALQDEFATSDLWAAQYKVVQPDKFGAWQGRWSAWQYQEGPDYSVCSDEWLARRLGIEPPVEPPVVEPPEVVKAITIRIRSDKAELQSVVVEPGARNVTALSTLTTEPFPVIDPTPEPNDPPSASNIYRILKDNELPASYGFDGKSRTASQEWADKGGRPSTPATVKLHGVDPVTNYPLAAVKLVHTLNDPRNAYTYVTRESAGWSNRGQTFPEKLEPIAFEGNLVDVIKFDGNRAYIRLWHGETDDPCVIHRWWNIDRDAVLHDAQNNVTEGPGFIVLAYPGEYWIEKDRLVKV